MHVCVEHLSYSVYCFTNYRVIQYYTPMMFVNKGAHFNRHVSTQCTLKFMIHMHHKYIYYYNK